MLVSRIVDKDGAHIVLDELSMGLMKGSKIDYIDEMARYVEIELQAELEQPSMPMWLLTAERSDFRRGQLPPAF